MKATKKSPGPDFLVIGAQKAGTSWLYSALSAHPEFWLPPAKEVHYFDHKFALNTVDGGPPPTMDEQRKRIRKRRLKRLNLEKSLSIMRTLSLSRFSWELDYAFGKRTDDWYLDLFAPACNRITGDITPDYSRLGNDAVTYVHSMLPDARIVFILRNPIDRAWSHAVMDIVKHRGQPFETVTDTQFIEHFESRASRLRTSYSEVIDRWQGIFGDERMFVGFFEQISEDPSGLIDDVCRFLGARRGAEMLTDGVQRQRVNPGKGRRPSAVCMARLVDMYQAEIMELARRYGAYPQRWRDSLVAGGL